MDKSNKKKGNKNKILQSPPYIKSFLPIPEIIKAIIKLKMITLLDSLGDYMVVTLKNSYIRNQIMEQ
jgi:hypothetical protein